MNVILFDGSARGRLLPLTFTRPVAELRWGILTIREKWEKELGQPVSTLTEDYLEAKFPLQVDADNLLVRGSIDPTPELLSTLQELKQGEALMHADELLAARMTQNQIEAWRSDAATVESGLSNSEFEAELPEIRFVWDIFARNGPALERDFKRLTEGRTSNGTVDEHTRVIGDNVFIEEGAKVTCAILNSSTGPIYIGKNAEVMEGSIIRGPFALCEKGVVKLAGKIYGPTTIGPYSKVGGEISNSVIQGYSNKGHDGFIGNTVLGEWCNLGADTNTSNLKNNYAEVRLWEYSSGRFAKTGLQFCGLIMGDHSKTGINTMLNTGTVVGVSANIFGPGFPRNFIPGFSWGGSQGFTTYKPEKAFEVAEKVMARRNKAFDDTERNMLQKVYDLTADYRKSYS